MAQLLPVQRHPESLCVLASCSESWKSIVIFNMMLSMEILRVYLDHCTRNRSNWSLMFFLQFIESSWNIQAIEIPSNVVFADPFVALTSQLLMKQMLVSDGTRCVWHDFSRLSHLRYFDFLFNGPEVAKTCSEHAVVLFHHSTSLRSFKSWLWFFERVATRFWDFFPKKLSWKCARVAETRCANAPYWGGGSLLTPAHQTPAAKPSITFLHTDVYLVFDTLFCRASTYGFPYSL